jgi:hypothetical protein
MGSVRTVRADWRRLPASVEKKVTDIGAEFQREVLGDDLFLLALTQLEPESPSRQVLEEARVTADILLSRIRTGGDGGTSPKLGMTYAPVRPTSTSASTPTSALPAKPTPPSWSAASPPSTIGSAKPASTSPPETRRARSTSTTRSETEWSFWTGAIHCPDRRNT